MAIRNFTVGPRRGLRTASAQGLPNLVAVAGANGSGKSALLELLWQNRGMLLEPGTEALYVGPNRTWRAGTLNDLAARSFNLDYEQILKGDTLPGFQYVAPANFGFLSGMSRFGSNADDAQALVKTSIVRIANRAEQYIAQQYRMQGGRIEQGSVPDLLAPFGELVDILLPHIQFKTIDTTNPSDVRVVFSPKSEEMANVSFDIDDLSSGEKAAIALFLPFIERQIRNMIGQDSPSAGGGQVPLTLLLDEPEIHLHPLLQLNVLEYMRRIAHDDEAQFIFTTHSPTLLDAMTVDELYLLSPPTLAPENQLSRLSHDVEKLEVARSITGGTHLLTRGKPIVFVEGEHERTTTATDKRLIGILAPETEHWAVVPSHGKAEVVRAVIDLRTSELALPGQPVFGIVDSDQGQPTGSDHVIAWPVAMVENLLLDPASLLQVLRPYDIPALRSVMDVERSLDTIVRKFADDEIRLRVQAQLPTEMIRLAGLERVAIEGSLRESVAAMEARVGELDLDSIIGRARDEVGQILDSGKATERFRGKQVLREFYSRHRISELGFGWNAFLTELAREATDAARTKALIQPTIQKIRLYVPERLAEDLRDLPASPERDELVLIAVTERQRWEAGEPSAEGRERFRQRVFQLARQLQVEGEAAADAVLCAAVAIGTPN